MRWASGRPPIYLSISYYISGGGLSSEQPGLNRLIITVTDGEGEVIEREAGCATGLEPGAHDGGRSFCATVTSAGLDGAELC